MVSGCVWMVLCIQSILVAPSPESPALDDLVPLIDDPRTPSRETWHLGTRYRDPY